MAAHPSPDHLKAFGLGKLDEGEITAVERHLATCDECSLAVAEPSTDSFLDRLRDAQSRDITLFPVNSADGVAPGAPLLSQPNRGPVLASELAENSDYEIVRELGRGGMGVVYLARNRLTGREEVLKVMNWEMAARPKAVERFLQEIQCVSKLDHPNIVRAYPPRRFGDLLVLTLEYIPGDDLGKVVRAYGPLPVATACDYARQVADGLQYAHEMGMAHRDIKPANLIRSVTRKGHVVKILDFGLVKLTTEDGCDNNLTGQNRILGSPEYIAPEQIQDASKADVRADIYSLGCTLYHMLTGAPPFRADSLYELLKHHQETDAGAPNLVRQDVPEELGAVVAKMIAKHPGDRYHTPAEVVVALAPFVTAGYASNLDSSTIRVPETAAPAGLTPVRIPTASLAPARRRPNWRGVLIASLALALMAPMAGRYEVVLLRIETANGTLVVEINDAGVEARIKGGTLILSGPDDKVRYTLSLGERVKQIEAGPYKIRVEGSDGLTLDTTEFTLKKGGEVTVRVSAEPGKIAKKDSPDKALLTPPLPSVLDALRRDKIPLEAMVIAGDGDPTRAPSSLVGVLGEAVPFQTEAILSVAFSPDGRWLASGSADKTIFLRETVSGRARRVLKGHTGAVSGVVFSKDSSSLVSSSHDGTIKIWPVEKEEGPRTLSPDLGVIRTLAASADGRFLAAGGVDRGIRLWKWGEWDKPSDLPGLKGQVSSLAFSPDGGLLASSWDGPVRFYQTADGKVTQTWPQDVSNRVLAFHRDGKWLATAGDSVQLWDVASGKRLAKKGGSGRFNTLALHPDGKSVYGCEVAGLGGFIFSLPTLDRAPGKGVHEMKVFREPHGIRSVAYSPNGELIAFGTDNGGVHVWDFASGQKQLPKQGHSHYVTTLSVSPNGRTVLSGGDENALRLWDLARPAESQLLDKTEFPLHDVAYSPDGRKYVTSASFWDHVSDMGIVWDAVKGTRLFAVDPPGKIFSFTFSPDGKLLAGSNDFTGSVSLWDANHGRQLHRFLKIGVCQCRPVFSHDSKLVAAATTDTKCVKVWDVAGGNEVASWTDEKAMCAIALSSDGRHVAAGHHDGAISLWDLTQNGRKERTWEGHSGRITRLRFMPDGKTLISSCSDGTIRRWNPEAARAQDIISLGPAKQPLDFDLDPSGRYLFAAGRMPIIFILRLP
ncbi:protein kinase domain-containing protein [Fimbriiglobus ruber]|uniref:High-affnity carbon uptake protein Hat/HatR n=1 Tax=Fimbriiglobus ruber TaxID=1908690 RepID=A0A225E6C8_9BACT|nr:protein kinase [Fimbriiglobus ruber]OWK43987.1 High-affnity carbon uptake protein Hat/HatR [Fimbriiglobus ruber]